MYTCYWSVYISGVFWAVVVAPYKSQAIGAAVDSTGAEWHTVTATEYMR